MPNCLPILLFIVAFSLSGLSCRKTPESPGIALPEDPNILVITIDTLRADHVGAYGNAKAKTPNLDELARKGVIFKNCYTSAPLTLPAHCSLFTGQYPFAHHVRDNGIFMLGEDKETWAEKMRDRGYHTYALIASFVLHSKFGLDQGFEIYDDSLKADELVHEFNSEITADQVYEKFRHWFDRHGKERFFAWIHFYDPHGPYTPPDEYKGMFAPDFAGAYDGEVAYTDHYVGAIVQDLKAKGLLDKTWVILTGDHGEGFGEHEEFGHSIFCYEEMLRVPLIFYSAGTFPENRVEDEPVGLIDIMPTVCDLLKIELPGEIQGRSFADLLKGSGREGPASFYFESMHGKEEMGWAPLTGLIEGDYKFIFLPEPELYDLKNNAEETENLFLAEKRRAKELQAKLARLIDTGPTSEQGTRRELTSVDRQHLEALGYVSSGSSKSSEAIDPKRVMKQKMEFEKITYQLNTGNYDGAEAELVKLVKANPALKIPQYFHLMKRVYVHRGDDKALIELGKESIAAFPDNDNLKLEQADLLLVQQRASEAQALAEAVAGRDPGNPKAHVMLGDIAERDGRLSEALDRYEKAASLDRNNASMKIKWIQLLARNKKMRQAYNACLALVNDPSMNLSREMMSKLGVLLTDMRQDKLAGQLLDEVLQAGEGNADAWNSMGVVYLRARQYDKAEEAFNHSIQLDPRQAMTFNNLGGLSLTLARDRKDGEALAKAIDYFTKALEIDPGFSAAYVGRGTASKYADRGQDAIEDWKKAIELNP
ncbi:MAG: sulfatase-like hydrolase/transferase, partial [Planctomycetota bacterium]